MEKILNELNRIRHLMMLNEDGNWRWESGASRGPANPLISPEKKWESGVSRGRSNPLYEGNDYDDTVFYHASNKKFDRFDINFIRNDKLVRKEGPGFYITNNKDDASRYGDYIYIVQLKPKHLVGDTPGSKIPRSLIQRLITMKPDWKMNAENWHPNPFTGLRQSMNAIMEEPTAKDMLTQIAVEYYGYEDVLFVQNAAKLGIDGLRVQKEEKIIHYIIYNPDIITILNIEENFG